MKHMRQLSLILVLFMTGISLAEAHAFLDHADPAVGSTVHGSPAAVKIWFTQQPNPKLSSIQVMDAKGKEVDQHDLKVDAGDPTLLVISVSKLPAGTYKVAWHAVCMYGHKTEGDFTFEVAGH